MSDPESAPAARPQVLPGPRGWSLRRDLAALLFYVLATIVLTWPLAARAGEALSLRGDYFSNLWNIWWMHSALDAGISPFATDLLHHPLGLSLARHTLSPINATLGALLHGFVDVHDAYRILVLTHFAFGGWCLYLLARHVSGCTAGALIAGVVWTFAPYHFHYLAQLNIVSTATLPLVTLCLMQSYATGRAVWIVGSALSAGLIAGTSAYYVVFAALMGALLLAGGRSWAPSVPWRVGARRLALAGSSCAAAIAVVAWPLLSSLLAGDPMAEGAIVDEESVALASNDLLGYRWSPLRQLFLAWPTALGFVGVGLVVAGRRAVWRRRFWIVTALVFGVLSLGGTLSVAGSDTGVPLPYKALMEVPLLEGMLRKPHRLFVMAQMAFAVLVACAWNDVAARIADRTTRRVTFALVLGAASFELGGFRLSTWPILVSPWYAEAAADGDVGPLLDLPLQSGTAEARYNLYQTLHGKPMARGYVTNLALTPEHEARLATWEEVDRHLQAGDESRLLQEVTKGEYDVVVVHKYEHLVSGEVFVPDGFIWTPFCLTGPRLLLDRQQGRIRERRLDDELIRGLRQALSSVGEVIHNDEWLIVFRLTDT